MDNRQEQQAVSIDPSGMKYKHNKQVKPYAPLEPAGSKYDETVQRDEGEEATVERIKEQEVIANRIKQNVPIEETEASNEEKILQEVVPIEVEEKYETTDWNENDTIPEQNETLPPIVESYRIDDTSIVNDDLSIKNI